MAHPVPCSFKLSKPVKFIFNMRWSLVVTTNSSSLGLRVKFITRHPATTGSTLLFLPALVPLPSLPSLSWLTPSINTDNVFINEN